MRYWCADSLYSESLTTKKYHKALLLPVFFFIAIGATENKKPKFYVRVFVILLQLWFQWGLERTKPTPAGKKTARMAIAVCLLFRKSRISSYQNRPKDLSSSCVFIGDAQLRVSSSCATPNSFFIGAHGQELSVPRNSSLIGMPRNTGIGSPS